VVYVDLCVTRSVAPSGQPVPRLGRAELDRYLDFVAGRCRPNTVLATAYDLKVFFTVVDKPPAEVTTSDVLGFITAQRHGGARGDVPVNPVPRGLPTRREKSRPRQGVSLIRTRRTLPKILAPGEVDALVGALRTHRDQAMVLGMVLGGLRRCEVLGLHLGDLRVAERRVFVGAGKGGHQRLVPVSGQFFTAVAAYLDNERPADARSGQLFVVLKRPPPRARVERCRSR
jgi:integrase